MFDAAIADAVEVGPDVYVLQGDGLWTPPQDVVTAAQAAADDARVTFENHPSAFANLGHNLLVLVGLFFLMVLPGLLAMSWFEARTTRRPARDRAGHVDRADVDRRHRGARRLARPAHDREGVDHRGRRHGPRPRAARRRRLAPQAARGVRRLLQRDVRGLLEPQLLDPRRCAVPGPGRPGRRAGRDREVDRLRRAGRLRHPERPVGRLPVEGGAGAVPAVHPRVAVRRRVHRPVLAPPRDLVDEHRHRGRRRGRRRSGPALAGGPDVRRRHRRDGGARARAAGGASRRAGRRSR